MRASRNGRCALASCDALSSRSTYCAIQLLRNSSTLDLEAKLPILSRIIDFRECATRDTAKMYCSCADRRELALAASGLNSFGFWVAWVEKNEASEVPLQCTSGNRPARAGSFLGGSG